MRLARADRSSVCAIILALMLCWAPGWRPTSDCQGAEPPAWIGRKVLPTGPTVKVLRAGRDGQTAAAALPSLPLFAVELEEGETLVVRAEDHSVLRIAKTNVVLLDAAPEFFDAL